jgi:hypothetical protein
MDFRVAPAEAVEVGLEARMIEPAKHLVELLAEEKANDRKWQSLKFHFLAEHAAKDLGRWTRDLTMAIGGRDREIDEFLIISLSAPNDSVPLT